MLNFVEVEKVQGQRPSKIVTRCWSAQPTTTDVFNIVCIKLQDLQNIAKGRTNYWGYEKPKFGTLEELIDVYVPSWIYNTPQGPQRVRPIKGNFNGGFQTHREAVEICQQVWANKERWRTTIIMAH